MGTDSLDDTCVEIRGVEVRGSRVHGRGVHALRGYRAGDIVLRWDTSIRVPRAQADAHADDPDVHLHPYDDGTLFVVQSPECFVNHACDNNTVVRDFMDVAVKEIRPGDEITSDYETDGAGLSFVCRCGSPDCRGVIGKGAGSG